jgi:ribosomal protein S18 acetylase RimI-like enzyme
MMRITQALAAADIAIVRGLFLEYQSQLGIDLSYQQFDEEVSSLPGDYAPPRGRLLLAWHDDAPVGCVGLREIPDGAAEMKRLFVRPSGRGLGVGHALVARLLEEAREAGYDRVVLDTLPSMQSAQRLYEQFGFRDIAAYRESPVPGTRFLSVTLGAA